jgi:Ser/Thr protein kinase RdoA (MazF antagonist)
MRLGCDGRLLALNSDENSVDRVGLADAAPVVVKFYGPGRGTDAAIREEHHFTLELAAADIPVATPLSRAGDTLHLCGAFRCAV